MMKKILYIGDNIQAIRGGAESVNYRNIKFIVNIFGFENVDFIPMGTNSFRDKILGYLGGLNHNIEQQIMVKLKTGDYSYVFISHSALGRVAQKIKKVFGGTIKIISFYHNIEKQYAEEYIRIKGITKLPFLLSVSYNEKLCVRYSDYNIVLNERDGKLMQKYYDKIPNLILPASYEDKFVNDKLCFSEEPLYLFVGTSFFANTQGVEWFIENVLPHILGKLVIVGNGMDKYFDTMKNERVQVYGFVDDLSIFYYQNSVVIAPIFSGGGMKTKIAEALMYGKTIVGTKEAFEGYIHNDKSMIECNTSEEFISVLKSLNDFGFNVESRKTFIENYSNEAMFYKFKEIFIYE